jgi:hypothetical protein
MRTQCDRFISPPAPPQVQTEKNIRAEAVIKQHVKKTSGEVKVKIHAFLTLALDRDE